MSAILAYLNNAQITGVGDKEESASPDGSDPEKEQSRCLICNKSFSQRSALTKHSNAKHTKETTFSQPFFCPKEAGQWESKPSHSQRMTCSGSLLGIW